VYQLTFYLNKEPRCHQCKAAVLSIESVVVSVESKVVQIKEPDITKYKTTAEQLNFATDVRK